MGTLQNKETPVRKGTGVWGVRNRLVQTGLTGLEPATSGVTDRHSNQLSYSPKPLCGAPEYNQKLWHLNACFTFGMFAAY